MGALRFCISALRFCIRLPCCSDCHQVGDLLEGFGVFWSWLLLCALRRQPRLLSPTGSLRTRQPTLNGTLLPLTTHHHHYQ